MNRNTPQLAHHPLLALPAGLEASIRTQLAALEHHLVTHHEPRTLVKVDEKHYDDLFLLFADRLLSTLQPKRVLLLVSAAAKPTLVGAWKIGRSSFDGRSL